MVRRPLAFSIALASILSLVAGGFVYAAVIRPPEGKVYACVSSVGYVRSAVDNKCPGKSKPVLLDKSGASVPDGGEGGALTLVFSEDPQDTVIETNQDEFPPNGTLIIGPVGKVQADRTGFYDFSYSAVVESQVRCGLDRINANQVFDGPSLRLDGQELATVSERNPNVAGTGRLWLTEGEHTIDVALQFREQCGDGDPESEIDGEYKVNGQVTLKDAHVRVYALES